MNRLPIYLRLLGACAVLPVLVGCTESRSTNSTRGSVDPPLTGAACRDCHAEVWQQWHESFHARAWVDTEVQAAFRHFGFDRKCQSCHAPEPIYLTGLDSDVRLRQDDLESGVNCLSCHAAADGSRVAAAGTNARAPCRPIAEPTLVSGRMCGVCHTAIWSDWQASRYVAEGKTCQTCHMPPDANRPGGVDHRCLGGRDDSLVRSGVQMTSEVAGGNLVVRVTNHATGHNFPGERHNRVLQLEIVQATADRRIAGSRQFEIKGITPFRGETSAEKIRVDQTVEQSVPIEADATSADVRLIYKRFPWYSDRDALIVHQQQLDLAEAATR